MPRPRIAHFISFLPNLCRRQYTPVPGMELSEIVSRDGPPPARTAVVAGVQPALAKLSLPAATAVPTGVLVHLAATAGPALPPTSGAAAPHCPLLAQRAVQHPALFPTLAALPDLTAALEADQPHHTPLTVPAAHGKPSVITT